MDSGLGSDEDRKGRTKEQKQLRNQQLLSGCFIDASSLSDEVEVDQRRNDERRQGALIFRSSIPQFSMLQMSETELNNEFPSHSNAVDNFAETSTPYNSIVNLEDTEGSRKTPLGFYVDLNSVPDVPVTPPISLTKKNIFSLVIDFEAPKKDKPISLSSSYVSYKKTKNGKQLNGIHNGSLSGSGSSINSSIAGPSKEIDNSGIKHTNSKVQNNISSSSSSNENIVVLDINSDTFLGKNCLKLESANLCANGAETFEVELKTTDNSQPHDGGDKEVDVSEVKDNDVKSLPPQFVKLSDLECQKTRLDMNFVPRMSRSIPESSWVESPLLMSRSAGYRSAPHPLEPENDEMYDSFTLTESSSSQPRKSAQRLGTDLLRMFLEEVGPDVTIEVESHKIKAHKCILASRCQYFAALLSGNWLEDSGNVISLQGFSYESVYFSLCHIYSGAAHVPDSISVLELASLADMLGLEGLKEVVEHALRQKYCHNFHKPCAGCCTGVPEVLILSAAYGLDDLYQKCLQWITQHFVKMWASKGFSSLPRELREKCYQQHVVHMTPDRVLETMTACEKILATLPAARWSESIQQLVLQLIDACHLYHRQHYAGVLTSSSFLALDSGPVWCVGQVEEQMLKAASNLGVEQACRSYSRCCKMVEQHWSNAFGELIAKIKVQLEQCLVAQSDRLIRSNAWLRLDSVLRARIKELTPMVESTSRLPRATPRKVNKPNQLGNNKSNSLPNPQASSSDSSRNSSPGMNQQIRLQNSGGSPSLRRSLLLAAKAPQVPPSPTINRRSTLTQPTAASAAKSAITKNNKSPLIFSKPFTIPKSTPARILSNSRDKPVSAKKAAVISKESTKRLDNRPQSPLIPKGRVSLSRKVDSRLSSPIKSEVRSPSPLKREIRSSSPMKNYSNEKFVQEKKLVKNIKIEVRETKSSINRAKISKSGSSCSEKPKSLPHLTQISKQYTTRLSPKSCNRPKSVTIKESNRRRSFDVPKAHNSRETEILRYSPEGSISPDDVTIKSSSSQRSNGRRRDSNSENDTVIPKPVSMMQRSDTFLKDEPTVIGKLL